MDTDTLVWIIVAVVIVLAMVAVVVMALRKKGEQELEDRREQAGELRQQASSTAPDVTDAQLRAEEADAKASLARTEAQRADEQAEAAKHRLAVEEAGQENLLRDADRVDPDVDHRSADDTGGSHRA
jgi:flagellar biosynthesis/type III secretory pathway M-ring protein FliF/YscJ